MNRVADVIGNEYQEWKDGSCIFISAPTGTGKTFFILNILLPYFSMKGTKILYLVNRRILKEQLETEISILPMEQQLSIRVESYQSIEKKIISSTDYSQRNSYSLLPDYQYLRDLNSYGCVVCDECHYFLSDSNYNTNTSLSLYWVMDSFKEKKRIFLSATIDKVKEFIEKDEETRMFYRTAFFRFPLASAAEGMASGENILNNLKFLPNSASVQKKDWTYEMRPDYSYINVNVIKGQDDILDIIANGKGKWLIFVDRINFGKDLEKELSARMKKKYGREAEGKIVMVSSSYERSEESTNEVNTIVQKNKQSAEVLIATSVMDNGINLKDIELRNVILMADNEVEFIQMLGRKRNDGKPLQLYLNKLTKDHFERRIWKLKKVYSIATKYMEPFVEQIKMPIQRNLASQIPTTKEDLDRQESGLIFLQHRELLRKLFDHEYEYNDISQLFFTYLGVMLPNSLAIKNIENLMQYYKRVMDKFDTDGEDAFIKEQLRWLGKTESEASEIIEDSRMSMVEKNRAKFINAVREVVGKPMNKTEAIEFKNQIKDELLKLLDALDDRNEELGNVKIELNKNDRPISAKKMDFLRGFCSVPFVVEVKDAIYTFKEL